MPQRFNGESFTRYGWFLCSWILLIPFQYGYHISVLNQIQAVLTCKEVGSDTRPHYGLPTCIPMSDFSFSVVTAIFTVGGLVGSMSANIFMDREGWGRKGAARFSALLVAVGSGIMSISASVSFLLIGRFLVGIGSGIGICLGPIYLAEIAPSGISGSVGVLTQLGIVLGIMITQCVGLRFATPTEWRSVLFLSFAASVAQLFLASLMVDSPSWLGSKASVEDPLLDNAEAARGGAGKALTVPEVLAAGDLRRPLAIVCFAMLSQQLSGINAVLYYSNEILSKSLPDLGPYVSLGITVVNVLMTFPPIILIERVGRRRLLALSTIGGITSLILVGFGLNSGLVTLASIAILTFVTSFAIGLGPVPFVLVPEVSPYHAVSALSSIALSLNWIVNFLVGLVFLPLRNLLSQGDPSKEGRVFYLFAIALFCSMGIGFRTADGAGRRM
ncbi:unnamed protein product [Mycena citricolor]|uniref:Major facilitator superfamily (MFS) profile domain-containing protein n=1 Tax=Mycena citricolor TaxID=2018698 RepID=A0AAD2K555_9AGAR|nr:unnamed protein product [Mycena citricolor]